MADHNSLKGAKALARRLEDYWTARGEPKRFEHFLAVDAEACKASGHSIYGVREKTARKAPHRPAQLHPDIHAGLMKLMHQVLGWYEGVTWENILEDRCKRMPMVVQARQACIRAAVASRLCTSRYQIAKFFNISHTSVKAAVRGTDLEAVSCSKARAPRVSAKHERVAA